MPTKRKLQCVHQFRQIEGILFFGQLQRNQMNFNVSAKEIYNRPTSRILENRKLMMTRRSQSLQ